MRIVICGFLGVLAVVALLAAVQVAPAMAGPPPDWVKELVMPSDGNQDHVVGEELC